MSNGNGTTWFEAIMDLIYNQMFTVGSSIYLPNIIQNGYDQDGLNIPPMDSTPFPDWLVPNLKSALPDSCSAGISQGNADFNATQQTLSGFHTVAQNGQLAFSNQDQNLVISLTAQNLVLSGSFKSVQNCVGGQGVPGAWLESCSGTFNCPISNVQVTINTSIIVDTQLSISVDEITVAQLDNSQLSWSATCPTCKFSQQTFFQSLLTVIEGLYPDFVPNLSSGIGNYLNSASVRNNLASIVNAQLAKI